MWQELLERTDPYLDARDIGTAIVAAFFLFIANMLRRWVMSRPNKVAATLIILITSLLFVLLVWKYAAVMGVVAAVFAYKVNIWILVAAYAILTIALGPWFIKNIHRIAAEVGGARNEIFIQEGKMLLDKPFDWTAQSDPSNMAHGAFKVVQLNGNPFYELDCTVEYSLTEVPKLSFGVLLTDKPISHSPNLSNPSTTDVYSGVDLFEEGLKARIVEGGAKRAFRKVGQMTWQDAEQGQRRVRLQFVVSDGCHLALLVDGHFMFAKPIHKEALGHLALFVHTSQSATFQVKIMEITIRVAKTELDLLLERSPPHLKS